MHPVNFLNGKNAPGFFLHYKCLFFSEMHCTPFLLLLFLFFFCFWCGIVFDSSVRCERLGAMKVKISVLSVVVVVRQHTRYADGGASVGDVWNSYRSS